MIFIRPCSWGIFHICLKQIITHKKKVRNAVEFIHARSLENFHFCLKQIILFMSIWRFYCEEIMSYVTKFHNIVAGLNYSQPSAFKLAIIRSGLPFPCLFKVFFLFYVFLFKYLRIDWGHLCIYLCSTCYDHNCHWCYHCRHAFSWRWRIQRGCCSWWLANCKLSTADW